MPSKNPKPSNYWKNIDNLRSEIANLNLDKLPTVKYLRHIKRYDLIHAISNFGGHHKLSIALNIDNTYKQKGYWDCYENLKTEITPIVEYLGHFPSETDLKNLDRLDLANAIKKKYGGFIKIADVMGHHSLASYKTLSGIIVRSRFETIVANYLYLNNIPFLYNTKISDSKYYCDFYLTSYDTYIEVWGMWREEYKAKRILKEVVYSNNNFRLISIESDLFKNNLSDIKLYLDEIFNISNNIEYSKLLIYESFTYDKVIKELFEFSNTLGYFPSKNKFNKAGYSYHVNYLTTNKVSFIELSKRYLQL